MVQKVFTKEAFEKDRGIFPGSLLEFKLKDGEKYSCGYFLDSTDKDIRLTGDYPLSNARVISMGTIDKYEIHRVK